MGAHPPRPRFTLTVGATGHRPNRLPPEIHDVVAVQIEAALSEIRDEASAIHAKYAGAFSDEAPSLTLVTALAEGADTMAAEAALSSGYWLDVVLPFDAPEYENDFSPEGRSVFANLCGRARSLLSFAGNRANETKAYETTGLAILDSVDVLLAVWDGGPAVGRGGTVSLVEEAARRGMPIIHIRVGSNPVTRLIWLGLSDGYRRPMHFDDYPKQLRTQSGGWALASMLASILRPPSDKDEILSYRRYLKEPSRSHCWRLEFPILMMLTGIRSLRWSDFRRSGAGGVPPSGGVQSVSLMTAYLWADMVGLHFSQVFRSAFTTNFIVSALAIVAAVAVLPWPWGILEILLVAIVVWHTSRGQHRNWHGRWIEARELAERLRIAIPMHAIATRNLGPYGDAPTWISWYARAKLREAGLRKGKLDAVGLSAAGVALSSLLSEQQRYHAATAFRWRRLNERITEIGRWLFLAALTVTVVNFLCGSADWATAYLTPFIPARLLSGVSGFSENHERIVVALSAAFPSLAAAFYGIRQTGDFEGAAQRSERLEKEFRALLEAMDTSLSFDLIRDVSHRASDIILGDVASWRMAVDGRRLEQPS